MSVLALIDYGAGNLRSVEKALRFIGAPVNLVTAPAQLGDCSGVVLPGVGAFDDCAAALRRQGLVEPVKELIQAGVPFLGICVGYQILFERSEEFDSREPGLGIMAGPVVRFPTQAGLKVPQIGWNRLELARPDCPLWTGLPASPYFYFVHSYFPEPGEPRWVSAYTEYGVRFAAALWKENVFGTQFHPEKSQENGLRVLSNFVAFCGHAPQAGPGMGQGAAEVKALN